METQRQTNKDPARFAGAMNLYGYAVNDPVNRTDPDGQDASDCAIALAQEAAACLRAAIDPVLIPACLAAFQNATSNCNGGGPPAPRQRLRRLRAIEETRKRNARQQRRVAAPIGRILS
jgi:hypothetical protein